MGALLILPWLHSLLFFSCGIGDLLPKGSSFAKGKQGYTTPHFSVPSGWTLQTALIFSCDVIICADVKQCQQVFSTLSLCMSNTINACSHVVMYIIFSFCDDVKHDWLITWVNDWQIKWVSERVSERASKRIPSRDLVFQTRMRVGQTGYYFYHKSVYVCFRRVQFQRRKWTCRNFMTSRWSWRAKWWRHAHR